MKQWQLLLIGWAVILAGGYLAHAIQTVGGISVRDLRFPGDSSTVMSGLLYTPAYC